MVIWVPQRFFDDNLGSANFFEVILCSATSKRLKNTALTNRKIIDNSMTFILRTETEEVDSGLSKTGFANQPDLFLLLNRVRMKAWFVHDSVFNFPKSFLFLKLSSGCASSSPRESALTHLLVLLIQVLRNVKLFLFSFNK